VKYLLRYKTVNIITPDRAINPTTAGIIMYSSSEMEEPELNDPCATDEGEAVGLLDKKVRLTDSALRKLAD
jgi:hypothetical protein